MKQVFETLETEDIDMTTASYPNMIEKTLTETLEKPFSLIMVPTSADTHRNRRDISINPDNNTNQENSHINT